MEFMEDLMSNTFKRSNKLLVIVLSFLPPLVVTILYPDLFLIALDAAEAFGVAILFGILSCTIAVIRVRQEGKKPFLAVIILILFLMVIGIKIAKETGLIELKPGVRYVRYNFQNYVSKDPAKILKNPGEIGVRKEIARHVSL